MKKSLLLSSALWMGAVVFAASPAKISHDVGQGTDCELFLNPYIEKELKEVSGQIILDAGCGLAPHSILAAKNGASVCAFETKKQLLDQAQALVQKAGVDSQISFSMGELEKLPYATETFDLALNINAEIGEPSTTHILSHNQYNEMGFGAHFREIARVMKEEGRLIVAAPASYDVVFSDGSRPEEAVMLHINQVVAKIGKNDDHAVITKCLSELEEVMRATFVFSEGKMKLVTNEKELRIGQHIWCKIPGGVIHSVYHSEEEYLVAIKRAGLFCEEIKRPCFFGNVKYNMWRSRQHECGKSLGEGYVTHHPFTIYYVVKRV